MFIFWSFSFWPLISFLFYNFTFKIYLAVWNLFYSRIHLPCEYRLSLILLPKELIRNNVARAEFSKAFEHTCFFRDIGLFSVSYHLKEPTLPW